MCNYYCQNAQVADFGLSRLEKNNLRSSNVRGTFGYVDPEYMSTSIFTKKSDVYSFGVLLFETMSSKSPQHGLMEYVEFVRSLSLQALLLFTHLILSAHMCMQKI